MNWIRAHLHYSGAVLVSIVAALIAVLVSFGLDLSQQNINSILTLVGLVFGGVTIGAGVKTAGLVRAGAKPTNFTFTPAVIVSIIGAGLALAVSFGFHISQDNIDSIMRLVGLIAGGIVVGGAVKSNAMLDRGINPLQTASKGPRSAGKAAQPLAVSAG